MALRKRRPRNVKSCRLPRGLVLSAKSGHKAGGDERWFKRNMVPRFTSVNTRQRITLRNFRRVSDQILRRMKPWQTKIQSPWDPARVNKAEAYFLVGHLIVSGDKPAPCYRVRIE